MVIRISRECFIGFFASVVIAAGVFGCASADKSSLDENQRELRAEQMRKSCATPNGAFVQAYRLAAKFRDSMACDEALLTTTDLKQASADGQAAGKESIILAAANRSIKDSDERDQQKGFIEQVFNHLFGHPTTYYVKLRDESADRYNTIRAKYAGVDESQLTNR